MTYRDFQGHQIRLSAERLAHIHERHPEMIGLERTISEALESPNVITLDRDDPESVRLYHRRFTGTLVGDKYIMVAVKFLENDAFVLTAFPTAHILGI